MLLGRLRLFSCLQEASYFESAFLVDTACGLPLKTSMWLQRKLHYNEK